MSNVDVILTGETLAAFKLAGFWILFFSVRLCNYFGELDYTDLAVLCSLFPSQLIGLYGFGYVLGWLGCVAMFALLVD